MDATIREATAEDAEDIRQVARESWHAAYDDVVGSERVESVVDSWYDLDGLKRSIAREDGRFLVAETPSKDDAAASSGDSEPSDWDAEVVGFAQAVLGDGGEEGDGSGEGDESGENDEDDEDEMGNEGEAAELPRIYVHPDRWGEGIGSELLDRIEEWLRERGAERLRLVVLADNEVGNAFYERHGYWTVGSRETEFEGETYADYVREKEL